MKDERPVRHRGKAKAGEQRRPASGRWDGRKVRALRAHLGLSQDELSEELGTRQQTVSEWETGRYQPRGTSARLLTIVAERAEFEYGPGESEPQAQAGNADAVDR